MLDATDGNEGPHGSATAKSVGQVFPPTTRSAELDRRGLFAGVTRKDSIWKGFMCDRRAKLVSDFHLHLNIGDLRRQTADDIDNILRFTVDKDGDVRAPILV